MVVVRPSEAVGRKASRGLDRTVISSRRIALGSGYPSWMKSVAVGNRLAATEARRDHGSTRPRRGRVPGPIAARSPTSVHFMVSARSAER
jgi:hypothetical protein